MFTELFVSSTLLFTMLLPECFADASVELQQKKTEIIALVDSVFFAQVKLEAEKLILDFADEDDIPAVMHGIASSYKGAGEQRHSRELHEWRIADFPDIIPAETSQSIRSHYSKSPFSCHFRGRHDTNKISKWYFHF